MNDSCTLLLERMQSSYHFLELSITTKIIGGHNFFKYLINTL